jgi:hypothetical protein
MTPITNTPTVNASPYLRTSRQFPLEIGNLTVELNTMYNEVSTYLNLRTIGLFPTMNNAITGEGWYLNSSSKQQSIRQVYTIAGPISAVSTTIPHFITANSYTNFVRIWGTFQDASGIWDTLPFVSTTGTAYQVMLQVDATNIIITRGADAPILNNVVIVLEYLSNV